MVKAMRAVMLNPENQQQYNRDGNEDLESQGKICADCPVDRLGERKSGRGIGNLCRSLSELLLFAFSVGSSDPRFVPTMP